MSSARTDRDLDPDEQLVQQELDALGAESAGDRSAARGVRDPEIARLVCAVAAGRRRGRTQRLVAAVAAAAIVVLAVVFSLRRSPDDADYRLGGGSGRQWPDGTVAGVADLREFGWRLQRPPGGSIQLHFADAGGRPIPGLPIVELLQDGTWRPTDEQIEILARSRAFRWEARAVTAGGSVLESSPASVSLR